jgi:hypothetical protein
LAERFQGLELSLQDALVLASIQLHLDRGRPSESCFLNRNVKDFDDPRVREMLDKYGCKLLGSFDRGLAYIQSRLRPQA